MPRIALLNPNTNRRTTAFMADIARGELPPTVTVEPYTMLLGPAIVTDEPALEAAARQIIPTAQSLALHGVDGIVISGFGDPGLAELRGRLRIPVTGIAEAGMAEAATGGRRAAVLDHHHDARSGRLDPPHRRRLWPRLPAGVAAHHRGTGR